MARYARIAPKSRVAEPPVVASPPPDLNALLKGDLVLLAEQRGLDKSGTKADLIARLGKP